MVLLAIMNIFIAKLSGQEDIIIGTPMSGRNHPDLEHIIGMFANTIALRNYPAGEKTFVEFLDGLKENCLEAFENQGYPFEYLVEKLAINRIPGRNPLFDVMFTLQNDLVENLKLSQPGNHDNDKDNDYLEIESYGFENKTSKFDFSLEVVEREQIALSLEYNVHLFQRESIDKFAIYFKEIAAAVIHNKNSRLHEIAISHEFLDAASALNDADAGDFGF